MSLLDTRPEARTVAVSVRLAADRAEVALAGELDLATAPAITRALRQLRSAGHQHVLVILDEVTFLDASTLDVLVAAHRDMTASGGSLRITPHPLMARLLRITGMADVFTAATE